MVCVCVCGRVRACVCVCVCVCVIWLCVGEGANEIIKHFAEVPENMARISEKLKKMLQALREKSEIAKCHVTHVRPIKLLVTIRRRCNTVNNRPI